MESERSHFITDWNVLVGLFGVFFGGGSKSRNTNMNCGQQLPEVDWKGCGNTLAAQPHETHVEAVDLSPLV